MTQTHLDAFTRHVAATPHQSPTRRSLLSGLAGGLLAAVLARATGTDARKKRKKGGKGGKGGGGGGGGGGGPTPPPPGSVFTVSGRDILTPGGNAVLLRGVNKMSVFDDEDPTGAAYFSEIAKTGANTVRIVWAITRDLSPNGEPTESGVLDTLIGNAINAGLLPMIELHDATGDWSRLDDLVNYWKRRPIVDIIAKHQRSLLVNIGNEVGDDQIGNGKFRDGYAQAVRSLRNAGIHTPLVIDAPDFGKNLEVLNGTAAALLDADPDHNLIFSVHLYWGIADGASPAFITSALEAAVAEGYPLIVGEFSKFGAFNGDASICAEGGRTDYQTILQQTDRHGIGWYAWEWGPGNGFFDPLCAAMDMTTDGRFATLQAGWATEVATTSPFGIKKTASPIL